MIRLHIGIQDPLDSADCCGCESSEGKEARGEEEGKTRETERGRGGGSGGVAKWLAERAVVRDSVMARVESGIRERE